MQDGQILLEWEEQVTVTDDLEPPVPELTPPPDYYDGSGIGHYRADPGR